MQPPKLLEMLDLSHQLLDHKRLLYVVASARFYRDRDGVVADIRDEQDDDGVFKFMYDFLRVVARKCTRKKHYVKVCILVALFYPIRGLAFYRLRRAPCYLAPIA